jgi:hypothetical protein
MGLKFKYPSVGQSAVSSKIPGFPYTVSEIFPKNSALIRGGIERISRTDN